MVNFESFGNWITSHHDGLLLTVTAIYALLTYKLWKESGKQTEIQQAPYLILRFCRDENCWYVKNVGHGVATKIEVDGVNIYVTDMNIDWQFRFDSLEVLESQSEKIIRHRVFENGEEVTTTGKRLDITPYLFGMAPSAHKKNLVTKFNIKYQNILGQRYFLTIQIDDTEYRILKFSKGNFLHSCLDNGISLYRKTRARLITWWKRRKLTNAKKIRPGGDA